MNNFQCLSCRWLCTHKYYPAIRNLRFSGSACATSKGSSNSKGHKYIHFWLLSIRVHNVTYTNESGHEPNNCFLGRKFQEAIIFTLVLFSLKVNVWIEPDILQYPYCYWSARPYNCYSMPSTNSAFQHTPQ